LRQRTLTFAETERLRDLIWRVADRRGTGALFALVDAARSPRAWALVEECRLPRACLYDPPLPAVLAEAAPYLIRLERDSPFSLHLIAHAFGESWGYFLDSAATLDELRAHLRQFLRVRDEDWRELLFRFYDPRVLRVYLPTCTADELRAFFGPVRRLCVEADPPSALLDLSLAGAALATERVAVDFLGALAPR
jgi:hypothetical protein